MTWLNRFSLHLQKYYLQIMCPLRGKKYEAGASVVWLVIFTGATTLSKMTFNLMTLFIKGLYLTLSISDLQHNYIIKCLYAKHCFLFIIMLSVIMLNAIILSVIMRSFNSKSVLISSKLKISFLVQILAKKTL
jgi:hypothetical protein